MVATDSGISLREINAMLSRAQVDFRPIQLKGRVRRALMRLGDMQKVQENWIGTMLPVPFDKSPLALRVVIGDTVDAIQYYASRFAANAPTVEVMPLTVTDEVTDKLDRLAGKQELFDAVLLDALGVGSESRRNHRKCAMGQVITDAGYYVLKPRDHTFGMPSREYYAPEEAAVLETSGKRVSNTARGYAEHPDDWRKRRQAKLKAHSALDYFDLQCYPRDMVITWRDSAGLKAAAIVESISAAECAPGSELARAWVDAHMGLTVGNRQVTTDDRDLWGLWKDRNGRIIGGLEQGGPAFHGYSRDGDWTFICCFTRVEMVYLVTSGNTLTGGQEIYRCDHGATDQGEPVVPVFEVPAMRTDIETLGFEFTGPMSQVFAYAPLIDQLETLFSAAAVWNTAPRFYCRLPDGTVLRDDNGEPKFFDAAPIPGVDPSQIGAYPGEILPLTINTETIQALLPIYLEQIAKAMPNKAATGDAGSSSAAWLAQQNIQQSQMTIQEPVANHREALTAMLRVAHDYLRNAFGDDELYFFQVPTLGSRERVGRGLVSFKASDLTDSFVVQQELETPDERTVALQIGNELSALGKIDDDEYYRVYYRARDAREMVIRKYQQAIVDHVMGVKPAAPGSFIAMVAESVMQSAQQELLQQNPVYALDYSRKQAAQAQQQAQQSAQGGGLGGPVSQAGGVERPGVGMATTLQAQLGEPAQLPVGGGPQ